MALLSTHAWHALHTAFFTNGVYLRGTACAIAGTTRADASDGSSRRGRA
jgi:hypothetical protein